MGGPGLRFGGSGEIVSIGPDAGVIAGRMEAGIELGPLSADLGLGVGIIWMDELDREEAMSSASPESSVSVGAVATLRASRRLALSGRASYHGAIEEPVAAAFVGLTLDWFPDLPLVGR
jgi:hypothetical protein